MALRVCGHYHAAVAGGHEPGVHGDLDGLTGEPHAERIGLGREADLVVGADLACRRRRRSLGGVFQRRRAGGLGRRVLSLL